VRLNSHQRFCGRRLAHRPQQRQEPVGSVYEATRDP
jgi:hypothetical protein